MTGTTKAKRRASDRGFAHIEYANNAFSPLVRRIANHLPPNERVRAKKRDSTKKWTAPISEEAVMDLLRRIARGESIERVASSASVSPTTLRNWYEGLTRPALRMRLDSELRQ